MKVTKDDANGLAALVDVIGAYGTVTEVDDAQEHITLELAGVAYRFVVEDGNALGVTEPMVMLLSVRGPDAKWPPSTIVVEETAGLYVVPPRIAERIVARFHEHGWCQQCRAGWHTSCERQAGDGTCRCRCAVEWAVSRVKASLGPLPEPTPTPAVAAAPSDAQTGVLLPRRALRPGSCGCECATGGYCGGCGHAGCAFRS